MTHFPYRKITKFLENVLYSSKTEINKNKTQIWYLPVGRVYFRIAPLWGVGPALGNTALTKQSKIINYKHNESLFYFLIK